MNKKYLPYYISRGVLSGAFGILVFGFTFKAAIFTLVVFGVFLLYLHSGWFQIDQQSPWFPVRRDERAQQVQRKALITAILIGAISYTLFTMAMQWVALPAIGSSLAISLAVLAYFLTQFILLSRA
jgi:uncharacterized membrane protein HdeD (DUF308 family)